MFLVLLYTSPAALLIYFTTNQFIALLLGLKKRFFGAFKINEDNKKSIIFLAVVSISIIFNLVFFKPLSIIFDNPQDIVGAPQLYLFHFLRLALIAASALFIVLFIPKSSGWISLKPSSAETGRRLTPKMVRMGTA
jgi:hypothetical protein